MRLKEASKKNPCIHCGQTQWCYSLIHENNENPFLTACRNKAFAAPGWEQTGKSDREGTIYYRRTDYRGYKVYPKKEQKHKEIKKSQSNPSPFSDKTKDFNYRQLIRSSRLEFRDYEALLKRGLKPTEIERSHFVSVNKGDEISFLIDERMPFVRTDWDGNKYYQGSNGLFCPIYNENGEIIGAQVRTTEGYRWLKTKYSSHTQNGELPITLVKGNSQVGIIEGILKPYIASCLHGVTLIGAAGGQWHCSPIQLKRYLEHLKPEDKFVIYYPDAGCMLNEGVVARSLKMISLVQSWGYCIKVADWGQLWNKEAGDFDEIPAGTIYRVISPNILKMKLKNA